MAKHGHRALFIAFVLGLVVLSGYSVLARQEPSTPAAEGAVASPEASPVASPVATPVVAGGVAGDVEAGKALATLCLGCHSVDGTVMVGPSWKGLYGSELELEDGRVVIVDEAYLERAIRDPMAEIVKGYPPAMPPYGYFTDQQVADLIAYIKSLE